MIDSRLSEILGRRRESIASMARGAGLSYAAAHALYHGTPSGITMDVLNRLCAYLDVQPGDLFRYVPDAQAPATR